MLLTELHNDTPPITQSQLDQLERYLDQLFSGNNIDIDFTHHFVDRVNDPRNRTQITIKELAEMFADLQTKYGSKLEDEPLGLQAVVKDMETNINCPFVLTWDKRHKMIQLVAKPVMRKPNFKTSNPIFKVH